MYHIVFSFLLLAPSVGGLLAASRAYAQSGVGTPWQFVHTPAGSCVSDGGVAAIAKLDQLCLDGDDDELWRCKTPNGAGANAALCDHATEWAGVGGTGGGATAIYDVDCATATIVALGTCIQPGPPDLYFVCPVATGSCPTDASAFSLPPIDTDTGVLDLQGAYNGGKQIIGVNSLINGLKLCIDNTVAPDGDCDDAEDMSSTFYCDPAIGCQWVNKPDGDLNFNAPSGFDLSFRLNGIQVAEFNHTSGKLEMTSLKSVEVAGHEFGACAYTDAVIAATKNKISAFTCTDIDTDGFDFDFTMPLNWNAGTVTVRLNAVSVNATPTNNVVFSCSGVSVSDGENIPNKTTTGEQTVTITFATQYKEEQATSATPITLNGTTLAGGDHVYMHCDVDATGTTATMADIRINAMAKVFYTTTSNSE